MYCELNILLKAWGHIPDQAAEVHGRRNENVKYLPQFYIKGLFMKRNIFIFLLMAIFSLFNNQINAQEPRAHIFTIENRIGKLTWIFLLSAVSSVIFYNAFKDMYAQNSKLYEYNLDDPTVTEKILIDVFKELQDEFSLCYSNPEEEHKVIMGYDDEDKVTEFKVYILSAGYKVESTDISFVFICNTVNNEQTLFCNIKNIGGN
jgi:hypothetical protein